VRERVEQVGLVGTGAQRECHAVDGAGEADQPEPGRVDVAELARCGEEAGSDQQPAAAERVGQCSGRHLRHQHADVQRGLDETELGQRQPSREQVHRPDGAGEDDAVEELVQPEDGQRARVHETPRVIGKPD